LQRKLVIALCRLKPVRVSL